MRNAEQARTTVIGATEVVKGTVRRRVEADGPTGMVPGLLHMPAHVIEPVPLVMLGHGGGGDKDQPQWQSLARFITRRIPAAVLCIDAPAHGERAPKHDDLRENFRLIRRAVSDPATADNFIQDWRAAIAIARDIEGVHPTALAYIGFSMGAMFGVPICAAIGVQAAVFGVGGIPREGAIAELVRRRDPEAARIIEEEEQTEARGRLVLDAAPKLTGIEVLQLNMTKDQIFPIEGALQLFDAFPGPKRFAAWEGGHTDLPRESAELAVSFLSRVFAGIEAALEKPSGTF
ncbi:MAG: alpha/beta fold hydrolase [Actinomycetota bacterium]